MITYQTITQAWYVVQVQGNGSNVWVDTENRQPVSTKGFDDACKWAKEATTAGKPYRVIKRTDEQMAKFEIAPPAAEKPRRTQRKQADEETND